MTDIYKKLYGYEDDIQLKDDDIKLLETGTILRKMKKEEFNDRFYRLDLTNNQLIASTKEFRKKEKIYPLISLNEVKTGCSSDNLKHYKLKKSMTDTKKTEDMENLAFVVTYDNFRNTLDLMATNQVDRDRWVRVLGYFILLCKKRKGVLPETDTIMRNYFELADKSDNKKLSTEEISQFIDTINFKLKKSVLKSLMRSCDMDGDGELNQEEFKIFMSNLAKRDEIVSLFKLIINTGGPSNVSPEFMSVQAFQRFLKCYQLENKTEEECQQIIEEYEPSERMNGEELRFSLYGFINYMNHPAQHIENIDNYHNVYQPMNFTFSNYYINSSHNTYLSGDQVTSTSSAECYKTALMMGARLVELDCYDGSDGQPRIYHQRTLTNKILFEDAIKTIKEYAFKKSEYPLILTLELHCGPVQQRIMAEIIKTHLKDYLFDRHLDPDNYPTLEELKFTILIRCQKPRVQNPKTDELLRPIIKKTVSNLSTMSNATTDAFLEQNDYEYISEDEDEDFEQMTELSDLVNCIQSAPFKGIDYSYIYYKANDVCSVSEQKCNKLTSVENTAKIIEYTRNYTTKVYPAYFRQDSSNMNPLDVWLYGFQIAALNFQTNDTSIHLNQALFDDNGGCGYVLKPDILRNPDIKFDPLDTITMPNKKKLEIKIISAQNLPRNKHELVKDISDPFVSVFIYGVQADRTHQKTKPIKNNGLNPIWNEDMAFFINCPELAFVKFVVKDQDIGKDDQIGNFTIRLRNMRTGYRHMRLVNKQQKGTLFVGIKILNVSSLAQMMAEHS